MVGAISVLYLPAVFNPKKTEVVDVVMLSTDCAGGGRCIFSPDNITVVIGINNTVRWTNKDNILHTVTGSKPGIIRPGQSCTIPVKGIGGAFWCPTTTPLFDSGDLPKNGTYTFTFTNPGVYEYFCIYHAPDMFGFVIVKK